ncbi:tetratricopeptide repeat protein [Uliginosibacterium gangwonense]|uniref:tetratricopeptide repeat protein n=1 Tax=Uliginosibacterium gangwonense TaxID=392736 RepID=UPI00035CB72E|nr:tetratricopeptide repeat protein [Uliginosibacterium gangwonense]
MSELIKKRVINDLICELADIDSVSLEIVGHKVIETLESKTLVHHGINKNHRPVGYTVDTFSQDFTVIGEYSTEDGYFEDSSGRRKENRFDKIENDLKHALAMSGATPPSKVYLVSIKEEPASFRGNFNKSQIPEDDRKRVSFLDARELAKIIFKSSTENSLAADFYRHYLPDFSQNLDRYEYFGRLPTACSNHQVEEPFIEAITRHFAAGIEVCVLYGLSGSGKTQAAIDYVQAALPEFGTYLWISGADWPEGIPLTAIKRARGGVAINAAGLFNTTRTLLVIDNFTRAVSTESFAELKAGFALGGRVLVTSQLGDPRSPIHLPLPVMSSATAFQVLGEDEATASNTCTQFVEACRFCPLILAVVREIAKSDDVPKDEFYREVLQDPTTVHEDDGAPVMERVLQRLSPLLRRALQKIADSGCTTYDAQFLRVFIGTNERSSLQKLAILNRTVATGSLSVHDLICRVLRSGGLAKHDLADAVAGYVEKSRGEMRPSVLRQIHFSADQLQAAHDAGRDTTGWLTYALLQVDKASRGTLVARLQEKTISSDMSVAELLCIVDAREAASYTLTQDERTERYKSSAAEYAEVAAATTDPEIRAEMLHHQGKALRRCGEVTAALACFRQLLAEMPDLHATYGQIAHLGAQKDATTEAKCAGEEALHHLVREIVSRVDVVPLRVSLATLSRVRSYPSISDALNADEASVKQFGDVVALSALEGFDQFYEAFVALTSLFGYRHGQTCLAVAEVFPDMLAIFPNAVDSRQWANTCEALANIVTVARSNGKEELASKLEGTMRTFTHELEISKGSEPFIARLLAKTFLTVGDPRAAIDAVNKIPENSRDHWLLYRQAEAELKLGDGATALKTAVLALESAEKDPRAKPRLSIYHHLTSQCYELLDRMDEALSSAKAALNSVNDEKFGKQLAARVKELSKIQA